MLKRMIRAVSVCLKRTLCCSSHILALNYEGEPALAYRPHTHSARLYRHGCVDRHDLLQRTEGMVFRLRPGPDTTVCAVGVKEIIKILLLMPISSPREVGHGGWMRQIRDVESCAILLI